MKSPITGEPAVVTMPGSSNPQYTYNSGVVVVNASVPLTRDAQVSVGPQASQGGAWELAPAGSWAFAGICGLALSFLLL